MKRIALRFPELGFIVATRAALAFGVGLLVSTKIPENRRGPLGMALVAIGAATTIPAVLTIRRQLTA